MSTLDLAAVSDGGPQTDDGGLVGLFTTLGDSVIDALEIAASC